ncbi:hypothetical protein BD560DRAFT_16976 [Blakeslea trispora]|nr:hypothetical protein BD560DRAFT_16976 [Blakeslea trispora]
MFSRVQQQELQLMNLRTADKIRKASLTPKAMNSLSEQSPMNEGANLLKQLDARGQNLRKLCEAEEQLTLEEYNQVALLKKENLEMERELENIHSSLKTEEEQEREQQMLMQELQTLEQQIKDKQQLSDSQDMLPAEPPMNHPDTIKLIAKSIRANHNRAARSTIELVEQYMAEIQQTTEVTVAPSPEQDGPVDFSHQLKSILSDVGSREKWLGSMKILCKQLMPDHIMGKTAGRLLEILIHQPNVTVSIDFLRKEFPPEREKRHQLASVILLQLEANLIILNEDNTISIRL